MPALDQLGHGQRHRGIRLVIAIVTVSLKVSIFLLIDQKMWRLMLHFFHGPTYSNATTPFPEAMPTIDPPGPCIKPGTVLEPFVDTLRSTYRLNAFSTHKIVALTILPADFAWGRRLKRDNSPVETTLSLLDVTPQQVIMFLTNLLS
ncbi:hypothetical protein F5Y18DRAFT_430313 [Xylariaceae sp. FL1019]|nr:hypothetical protein F5Y18DRAFT_430313 [Xylariaceae sp. FL1019]